MTEATSIFVADDHPLVLRGLLDLISGEPGFKMLGSCEDGMSALASILELKPDIAVLDYNMPQMTGMDILVALRDAKERPRIVLLTAEMPDYQVFEALQEDVDGLVLKSSAAETLLVCLHHVAAGHRWLPEEFVGPAYTREEARREMAAQFRRRLTERERQIVKAALASQSNKEIARQLKIAEGTVKIHLNNVYSKLGIASRTSLGDVLGSYLDLL
jgi:DNA-binding NarL/FixJ family response regulator